MKIVFLGTPSFAVKPLIALFESRHKIVAVVSQPDRAKDRKGNVLHTPVKQAALERGLTVLQFESIKKEVETLKKFDADIFITAAYGQILSQEVLDIPRYGVVNAHGSLLPKYRGASPIQSALLHGETKTGVTVMQTDIGLDSGDILLAEEIAIEPYDTTATLLDKLSELSAKLLIKTLDGLEAGAINGIRQDHSKATKCTLITKNMGRLDFSKSAAELFNMIRAIDCHAVLDSLYVKILKAEVLDDAAANGKTADSNIGSMDENLIIQCGKGQLKILELLPQNRKRMTAAEFLRGFDIKGKKFE